jgi:hypothetical protein
MPGACFRAELLQGGFVGSVGTRAALYRGMNTKPTAAEREAVRAYIAAIVRLRVGRVVVINAKGE